MNLNLKIRYFDYILLFIVAFIPIFAGINNFPIIQYDEARNTINAYEMYENKKYFVTYFNGEPDMWNTKPPMLAWLQVYFMNLIGPGEIAIRLPSAIAALFTSIFLYWFVKRLFNSVSIGLLTVITLLGSSGYMSIHGVRTGDYDSLLTFFTTVYIISFFIFITEERLVFFYLFTISIIFACLTKGVAGLFFLPAIFLITIVNRKIYFMLRNKNLYISIFLFIVFVGGFYVIRESLNPGYIKAVLENELLGRFNQVLDQHQHPFYFYFYNIFNIRFGILLTSLAFLSVYFVHKNEKNTKIALYYIFFSILSFLIVISISKTKLFWYDLPVFPLISILSSFSIIKLTDHIFQILKESIPKKLIISILILFFVFPTYFKVIAISFGYTAIDEVKNERYNVSKYLKGIVDKEIEYIPNSVIYFKDIYTADYDFYIRILRSRDIIINLLNVNYNKNSFSDIAITGIKSIKDDLEENYASTILYSHQNVFALSLREDSSIKSNLFQNYNLKKYRFNKKGIKLVPNKVNPNKVLVVIDKNLFNEKLSLFFHSILKINNKETFVVNDIGLWNGNDMDQNYSYKIINNDGEFVRACMGQYDIKNPQRNWAEWFGR